MNACMVLNVSHGIGKKLFLPFVNSEENSADKIAVSVAMLFTCFVVDSTELH